MLYSNDGIRAIDARGAVGPKAFEFVIQFIIELREWPEELNQEEYDKLFSFFTSFVDADELRAALFFFWVYKMDDYVFQKNKGERTINFDDICKVCCTEEDKKAAEELAKIAELNIEEYGMEMLKAGTDISDLSIPEILFKLQNFRNKL